MQAGHENDAQYEHVAGPGAVARSVVHGLAERTPQLTERTVASIVECDPVYRGGSVVAPDDLWRTCRRNLSLLTAALAEPVDRDVYLAAPRDTGSARAEQGLPLENLLRAYRLGGATLWEELLDQARRSGAAGAELAEAADGLWHLVDEASAAVTDAYHHVQRELAGTDGQVRAQLLADVLRGDDPVAARQAAGELGLPAESGFVVVAAELDTGSRAAVELEDTLWSTGIRSWWQRDPGRAQGLVELGERPAEAAAQALQHTSLRRAGVSAAFPHPSEASRALREAELALRTMPAGSAIVALIDERLAHALVVSSPELNARLVERCLGPLLRLPAGDRDALLRTLREWLDANGSVAETAERLYCHRNTVHNHLRRISELTGRDLRTPTTQAELLLAVAAVDLTDTPEQA